MEELDEVVENVEEGGLLDLRRALPKTEEPLKDGGVLSTFFEPNPKAEPTDFIVFNDSPLEPYFVDDKLENLRTNSFLEGENDVSMSGLLDQNKNDSSQQESKAENCLYKAPWAVGKVIAAPDLQTVFDRGKGLLC